MYHSLASHIWITLTRISSLDWKRCLVFPKLLGHEMDAGWSPKPLIRAEGKADWRAVIGRRAGGNEEM